MSLLPSYSFCLLDPITYCLTRGILYVKKEKEKKIVINPRVFNSFDVIFKKIIKKEGNTLDYLFCGVIVLFSLHTFVHHIVVKVLLITSSDLLSSDLLCSVLLYRCVLCYYQVPGTIEDTHCH